jgi:uncharacterized protein YecE (DUF72 family)
MSENAARMKLEEMAGRIYIGTAGWSIPRASAGHFPQEGTHLQRYARVLDCAEINSSFYRPHAASTYAKWAALTGDDFRFAVKLPKLITHELRFRRSRGHFEEFLEQTCGLGHRRGPLLVQLPPSFAFEPRPASLFFNHMRAGYEGPIVLEPRHVTWFSARAEALLKRFRVGRVAADPPTTNESNIPGGDPGVAYFRLHGTPRMYWSRYDAVYLAVLATQIRQLSQSTDVWCVFDNTASGAALENAWELQQLLSAAPK